MYSSLLKYAYEEEENLFSVSIDGLSQIQQYTTKEKNATPFSFAKGIASGNATTYAGYRASDLVQSESKIGYKP
jgi:hypothetical protein